jgi:hypothetical protein
VDTRYGTWNIMRLDRSVSLNFVSRELEKYKLNVMGI